MYHERWEIETAFDAFKTHQRGARRVLRSKTPDLVQQEAWGFLLAHFAIRALMHEAALGALPRARDPDSLSFVPAVRVIRRTLPHLAAIPPSRPAARPSHDPPCVARGGGAPAAGPGRPTWGQAPDEQLPAAPTTAAAHHGARARGPHYLREEYCGENQAPLLSRARGSCGGWLGRRGAEYQHAGEKSATSHEKTTTTGHGGQQPDTVGNGCSATTNMLLRSHDSAPSMKPQAQCHLLNTLASNGEASGAIWSRRGSVFCLTWARTVPTPISIGSSSGFEWVHSSNCLPSSG